VKVLGDWETEATEVYAHNPWLTYALPLHMAREFGIKHKLFDVLDERPLHALEVRASCAKKVQGTTDNNAHRSYQ